jgi:hypothetical protein
VTIKTKQRINYSGRQDALITRLTADVNLETQFNKVACKEVLVFPRNYNPIFNNKDHEMLTLALTMRKIFYLFIALIRTAN